MKWPFALVACLALASCDKEQVTSLSNRRSSESEAKDPKNSYLAALIIEAGCADRVDDEEIQLANKKSGQVVLGDHYSVSERESICSAVKAEWQDSSVKADRLRDVFLKSSPPPVDLSSVQNFSAMLNNYREEYSARKKEVYILPGKKGSEPALKLARDRYNQLISDVGSKLPASSNSPSSASR